MPMDWLNTPVDVPISELIARKKRARMIEMLRAQLEGRLAPGVQVRLQLADLLVQAGRGEEAVPVLIGLADEFASDGFVAKAIAILKRVEKVHQGRDDVASRLTKLVQQQQRAARAPRAEGRARAPVELGIEEFDDAALSGTADAPGLEDGAPDAPPPSVDPAGQAAAGSAGTGDPAAPAGVAHRIRGAFKRFLAGLPNPPEPAAMMPVEEGVPSAPPAEPPPAAPDADVVVVPVEELIPLPVSEDTAPVIVVPVSVPAERPTEPPAEPPVEPPVDPPSEEEFSLDAEAAPEELEITLDPDPDPETDSPLPEVEALPTELSAEAYEERLLDIVEDVLQRPPAADLSGAPVDRPRLVEYADRLLAMPLFSDLSEEELLAVVRGLRVHTFAAGDVVLTERERGQSLFILISGRVKVFVRNPAGRNYLVAQIRNGEFFGEIATLSGRPRSATIVAAAVTDILELDKPTLDGIARTHPRVCDVLEDAYIRRASSPEVAAIRSVPLTDPMSDRRAIEVLEAHFGESRWDPRMRLRLADVLVRAGKEAEAVPILVGLADDLARGGYPEKAISILKKIEQLHRRHIEEVSLAPSSKQGGAAPHPPETPRVSGGSESHRSRSSSPDGLVQPRGHTRTDEFFHTWLLDTVRDAVGGARPTGPPAPAARVVRGYGPGFRASPLFEGFAEDELLVLIQGLRLLTFAPGDMIVTEGEPGQSVFILATGKVKVFVRSPEGHDVAVGALAEGSFFGEMSTLSGHPRSATVTAASPCDLLELDRATLDRIAVTHPHVRTVLEDHSRRRAADPAAAAARGRRDP